MEELVRYFFNVEVMRQAWPFLLKGLGVTLQMGILVIVLGVALGLLLACLRSLQFAALSFFIVAFVDVFRALPALVVLMVAYFALPAFGLQFSPFTSAVVSLALVLAAFSAEIFWAGITSVDRGQWEAARSTGLSYVQTLVWVVLSQAIRMVLPPLTNRVIAITKNTAIASAVSVEEILNQASSQQALLANPTPLTLGALMFVAVFMPLVLLSRWLERRQEPAR